MAYLPRRRQKRFLRLLKELLVGVFVELYVHVGLQRLEVCIHFGEDLLIKAVLKLHLVHLFVVLHQSRHNYLVSLLL